jgi:hypothetical protein
MADAQELHQIEYRHHQMKDLSPVTSSMSVESVRQWDARIRTWVRHPHADRLSESVCYQVFSNGQAALAWRYWDQRAAERADGTRGRPLVSRVLVGPATVLAPEVAVALCKAGLRADFVGPLPGDVPDGSVLPIVNGDALKAMTDAMTEVLDLDAQRQAGLQAVVAAALADPSAPLAVGVEENLIQQPLREGVQYPLLWGLLRIAGPVLGPVGRGWSFSTFEPPLGDMDPASLPGIVFRQAQDGAQPAPSRWRKEVKVRPLSPTALHPGSPFAGFVEMARGLVIVYQERGGDGLAQFIASCCGSERSLSARLGQIYNELRNTDSPLIISPEATRFISLPTGRVPAQEEPESPGPGMAAASGMSAGSGMSARSDREEYERHLTEAADAPPTITSEPPPAEASELDSTAVSVADEGLASSEGPRAEWRESEELQAAEPDPAPATAETVIGRSGDTVYQEHHEPWRGEVHSPGKRDVSLLASSKSGQRAPELSVQVRGRRDQAGVADTPPSGGWFQSPRQFESVSKLLEALELVGNDTEQFESILQRVLQPGRQPIDPNDRVKSWEVISHYDWYDNISKFREFHLQEIARIFGIVVIPDLVGQDAPEAIARWACNAQPLMISGLLAAARQTSPDTWQAMMRILESVLAARWAADNLVADQWDADRVLSSAAEFARSDNRRGLFNRNPRRRH